MTQQGEYILKSKNIKLIGTITVLSAVVSGCATFGTADERWADYRSWTKITEGRVNTGDPTGFVGNVHAGPKGYRDIFVNRIGIAANQGKAPYNYPVGSVLVKEQYKDKAAWEAQGTPGITVMVKVGNSSEPSANNWQYAAGLTDKPQENAFCSGCHTAAIASDFVFTNEDFFNK